MSKDIFMADYSECRDTNREIQSNVNYIEDIISRLKSMDNLVQGINVPSNVWDKTNYESDFATINRYLNEEENRYTNFHPAFDAFYTSLEKLDAGLKSMLNNALDFIKENKEYGVYVSIIKSSEKKELEYGIYDELIKRGINKEEAIKISALANEKTQDLIDELLKLDESELKSKIEEIKHKAKQSPSELIILDILSSNKGNTYCDTLKDISAAFTENDKGKKGGFSQLIEKGYLAKSIDKYNLDVDSLSGQIRKLEQQISTGQLSQSRINVKTETMNRLKLIQENKLSNISKYTEGYAKVNKVGAVIGKVSYLFSGADIINENWKDVSENGAEWDDTGVSVVTDGIGVVVSAEVGGLAGAKIGGIVGEIINPVVGGVIGLGVGFAIGGLAGFAYGAFIKPVIIDGYNNYVEPALESGADKANDVGDWWDSLWW